MFFILVWGNTSDLFAQDFFVKADRFFQQYVQVPHVDYAAIHADSVQLAELRQIIADFSIDNLPVQSQKAFWINAYNLLVIGAVIDRYPLQSPKDIAGFFDRYSYPAAGAAWTLNDLERKKILEPYADARVHFALVCAAISCPPLQAEAYWPERLDAQLENVSRLAINDSTFVRITEKEVLLSPIFRWYALDFGNLRDFLQHYLEPALPNKIALRYYPYNWRLNEKISGKALPLPFRASYLLQSGEVEIKFFQSLYTQKSLDGFAKANSRSTYFSSFGQFLFGSARRWNWGFDFIYKSNVINDRAERSPFRALRFQNFVEQNDGLRNADGDLLETKAAIGLSHWGPKFKINPIPKWENLSWQQSFYLPIQHKVDGQWVSFSQFFYDRPMGTRFQFFSEISLWMTMAPRFSLFPAVKVFYSYFPKRRWTIYGMTSIPVEYGLGSKFQLSRTLEIELLYTHYLPITALVGEVRPSTFNLGFRYRR